MSAAAISKTVQCVEAHRAQDRPFEELMAELAGPRHAEGTIQCHVVAAFKLRQVSLDEPAQRLAYLDSKSWKQDNLLRGKNGIAALTFCEVPLLPARSNH